MREKQRRADLKAQGIDPDAVDEPKTKQYDDKYLQQYNFDYGEEEVEESKEEEVPQPKPQQQKKN